MSIWYVLIPSLFFVLAYNNTAQVRRSRAAHFDDCVTSNVRLQTPDAAPASCTAPDVVIDDGKESLNLDVKAGAKEEVKDINAGWISSDEEQAPSIRDSNNVLCSKCRVSPPSPTGAVSLARADFLKMGHLLVLLTRSFSAMSSPLWTVYALI